jgi:hypothetical protein
LAQGHRLTDPLAANAHILDALGQALVIVGLLLAVGSILIDPPLALVALAGGGTALAWTGLTAATVGQLVVAGTLSGVGVALMDAGGHGGGKQSDGQRQSTASDEASRLRSLGEDPATGKYRPAEEETARRVETERGVRLRRSPDPKVDWVDEDGATYDALGNFDGRFFDQQWPNLQVRIMDHLAKSEWAPIDVSRFTSTQVQQVRMFIKDLGPRVFLVGE